MSYLLIQGDARHLPLADRSVHCVITSPPYYGLRDYGTGRWEGGDPACDHKASNARPDHSNGVMLGTRGVNGGNAARATPFRDVCSKCGARRIDRQIGMEPTPDAFVATMVEVFREVRRILRDDGTVWLNLGDSYCNAGSRNNGTGLDGKRRGGMANTDGTWADSRAAHGDIRHALRGEGIKHKDLLMMPHRVALALQADGWIVRMDNVWHKKNPMPESVNDRPSKSHEYVFLLSKEPRYFYDAHAVRETMAPDSVSRYRSSFGGSKARDLKSAGLRTNPSGIRGTDGNRNLRSVWSIASVSYKGAHFATFPPKLILPMIKAGTSEKGCCPACGKPWVRITRKTRVATRPGVESKVYVDPPVHPDSPVRSHAGDVCGNRDPKRHTTVVEHVGWKPGCQCDAGDPVPCVIFDPFVGSGTTLMVAEALGRNGIGLDLSGDYLVNQARRRIERPHAPAPRPDGPKPEPLPLFRIRPS